MTTMMSDNALTDKDLNACEIILKYERMAADPHACRSILEALEMLIAEVKRLKKPVALTCWSMLDELSLTEMALRPGWLHDVTLYHSADLRDTVTALIGTQGVSSGWSGVGKIFSESVATWPEGMWRVYPRPKSKAEVTP